MNKKIQKQIKTIKNDIKELKDDWKTGACDMIENEYHNYLSDLNDQLEELEKLID